ncbi:MAG: histidine kinase [Rhodothermales bacterium]|nr:histidine kinase [Rhodothermales bacterium]
MTRTSSPPPRPAIAPTLSTRWRWIEGGLLVLFWGTFALLAIGREAFNPHFGGSSGLHEGEALYMFLENMVWASMTPVVFWISTRLFPDRIGWLRTILGAAGTGVTMAIVVDMIDHMLWNGIVAGRQDRPLSIVYILSNFHFLTEFFVYTVVLIAGYARAYFLRSQEHLKEAIQLRVDAARLQTHLAEARLRALRMQINPHFLFNTLHVISDHFEEDPRAARRMIARLSEILRYTFEGTETREVPLSNELRFLDGYLDIQRFRFEDRLAVNLDIAPEAMEALVPTLILQPLVENAIKHGVSQIEGPGVITIRAWRDDEQLHLRVADNGPGVTKREDNGGRGASGGIGLRNTRERLETLYGTRQQFTAESAPGGGFVARIVLPYHTSSDYFLESADEDE